MALLLYELQENIEAIYRIICDSIQYIYEYEYNRKSGMKEEDNLGMKKKETIKQKQRDGMQK